MGDGVPSMAGRQSQAIRTALAVLNVVAQAQSGVTAGQISAELRLPRATTYRIINVLAAEGYLARLDGKGGLALGARALALGGSAPGASGLAPGGMANGSRPGDDGAGEWPPDGEAAASLPLP